jgi:hypothetical protein
MGKGREKEGEGGEERGGKKTKLNTRPSALLSKLSFWGTRNSDKGPQLDLYSRKKWKWLFNCQ